MKYAVVLLMMVLAVAGTYFAVFHEDIMAESSSSSQESSSSLSSSVPLTVSPEESSSESETSASASSLLPESLPEESSSSEPEKEQKPAYSPTDWKLRLINPDHLLPEDYHFEKAVVEGDFTFDARAVEELKQMLADGRAAGHSLRVVSTYRTVERSEYLYNRQIENYMALGYSEEDAAIEAGHWVAPPWTSEHNAGLCIDVVSTDYDLQYGDLMHEFEQFDSFTWLSTHCSDYGFVLRYPKDKQEITGITYEPWHYRYVGVENAKLMEEKGFCLEEYLQWLQEE